MRIELYGTMSKSGGRDAVAFVFLVVIPEGICFSPLLLLLSLFLR